MLSRSTDADALSSSICVTITDDCLPGGVVKAVSRTATGRGGERDISVLVNVSHFYRFAKPVIRVVLDNAQRVDPDIIYAQAPCITDGLVDRFGSLVPRNRLQVSLKCMLCCA